MINEEATFEKFGYYSTDLKPKSNKKIVVACDDCGKIRESTKNSYHALCTSCAQKGERHPLFGKHHSEGTRKKMSDAQKGEQHPNFGKKGKNSATWKGGSVMRTCQMCGIEFPARPSEVKQGKGKFCTRGCHGKWMSENRKGENHPSWKGGHTPYCSKWNEPFREYIREKFGRVCFLCGKTEEENGRRLSVHHVNYNKDCGCDDDETCQFVPLCIGGNTKVNSNREMWAKKIKDKMKNKLNGWYI